MATVTFPDGTSVQVQAPDSATDAEIYQLAVAQRGGESKPSFLQALGQSAMGRLGEIGQFPGYAGQRGVEDAATAASMLPGPWGVAGAGLGHLARDYVQGKPMDVSGAATDAGLVGALGLLGKIVGPLSKLRPSLMGQGADAALAADAVRGAGTALQPSDTAASLMATMRGKAGEAAMSTTKDAAETAIAQQLPTAPTPIDKTTRAYLDAVMSGTAPTETPAPALSREAYQKATQELTDLGRQGFNLRGAGRDSPQAIAAREQYGELLGTLKDKLAQQDPALLEAMQEGRRDYSAATELRRLFRPNTGEGPDRVFRPSGFNMQDVQERAAKRIAEIQGRLGPTEAEDFLRTLYRGGVPGTGTDRPLAISSSKFGGFRIPLPFQILAGPQTDPRVIQMLLQGAGPSLSNALGP